MKTLLKTTGILLVLLSGITVQATAQTAEVKIKTSAQCDDCKERIEKALAFEKGIKSATVDVEKQEITVVYYDKRTSPEKIREAVSATGYDADDVPAKKAAYDKLPTCCKKGGH